MSSTAMHSVDHHSLIRGNVCVTDGAHSKCTYGHDRKLSTVISQGLTPCPVTEGVQAFWTLRIPPMSTSACQSSSQLCTTYLHLFNHAVEAGGHAHRATAVESGLSHATEH